MGHGLLFRAGALATVLCLAVPASAVAATKVRIDFDRARPGTTIKAPNNLGTGKTDQYVLSQAGGKVKVRRSGMASGRVADFPNYDGDVEGKRAVITIVNAKKRDHLTPRSRNFSFGAKVNLDPMNAGTVWDDGNNLMQRGLQDDDAQYKIEIDKRRPSCRVKGKRDALEVISSSRITTQTWYLVKCTRVRTVEGDRLTLAVIRILADGSKVEKVVDQSGLTLLGKIRFGRRVPLSVGGKLSNRRTIERRSDQLNGRVDDVFLRVRRKS